MKFSTKNQYLSTICVNLITISFGTSAGWTSANIILLQSADKTPLKSVGPLNNEELSWITSILSIGGLLGTIFYGWLSEHCSRKFCLYLSAIPQTLSWILIIFATNTWYLYLSRCLSGISGGAAYILVPLFVAETAEDKVRGTLGAILTLSFNVGILLGFIAGNFLTFYQQAYALVIIPCIFMCSVIFLPETPFYLVKTDKMMKAEKSLKFYRNFNHNEIESNASSMLRKELENLQTYLLDKENSKNNKYTVNDFIAPVPRKALFIGIVLIGLNEFSGVFPMLHYTATIFEESGSNLTPNMSAIIVGVIQMMGTYVSTILVDRIGRKLLLTISAIGACTGLLALGSYTYLNLSGYILNESLKWIPILSFSFFIFLASIGIVPIPFIYIAEIMPEKIRNIGISICIFFSWSMAFTTVKTFATISAAIGMHGSIFVYATFCLLGTIFIIFYVPETKGKCYQEIFDILKNEIVATRQASPSTIINNN